VHYSNLFQYFFSIYYGPYSSWKFLKPLYPYCACHTKKEMHSRDKTVLIDLLRFNVMHYSSLFQYFFRSNMILEDFLETPLL